MTMSILNQAPSATLKRQTVLQIGYSRFLVTPEKAAQVIAILGSAPVINSTYVKALGKSFTHISNEEVTVGLALVSEILPSAEAIPAAPATDEEAGK